MLQSAAPNSRTPGLQVLVRLVSILHPALAAAACMVVEEAAGRTGTSGRVHLANLSPYHVMSSIGTPAARAPSRM